MAGWFLNHATHGKPSQYIADDDDPLSIMQPGSALKLHCGVFIRQILRGSD